MTEAQTQERRDIALVSNLAIRVSRAKRIRLRTKEKVLSVEIQSLSDNELARLRESSSDEL